MKKLIVIFIGMFYLLGCSEADSNPLNSYEIGLTGNWELVKAVRISDETEVIIPIGYQTLSLNSNGIIRVEMEGTFNSGNWSATENVFTVTFTEINIPGVTENQQYNYPYQLDGSTLKITTSWDFDGPEAPSYLFYEKQ